MLKTLLASSSQIVVPGVYDALSSHIASQYGFKALYMSGFAVWQVVYLISDSSPAPKWQSGHMENKQVTGLDEAMSKIRVGVDSRTSDNFLVMARTDSRATHDLAEAIRRGKAFPDAGADQLFDIGYQIILRPVSALLSAAMNLQMSYQSLQKSGCLDASVPRFRFGEFNTLVGLDET